MALDERKKQVLQAIVDDYVTTYEPVGSKTLIERHDFTVSSATLRNEMAELERLGFLEKPHTSAGRIPSDKGYREYVDSLLKVDNLTEDEKREIEGKISDSVDEVTDLLKNAADTLSETTGFVSIAMSPRLHGSYLMQLKILMIEPGKALVVVVLSAGVVKDKVVRIPNFLTSEQLMKISNAVERHVTGKSLDEITYITLATSAKEDAKVPDALLNQVVYEAYTAIKQAERLDVYLQGEHRMLSLPDFSELSRARDLLGTLSRDGMVAGYVSEIERTARDEGREDTYMIRIGQEIALDGLDDCSFITTTYKLGDTISGNIGIIGPKRMDYSKVISQINFVRKKLNDGIRRLSE